ncbi:MAG: methyltransferase domain-containing protein [Anaerolineales bacterium]|nr:methyltransferase domain-containing protein [Anaerolineales bacterium]
MAHSPRSHSHSHAAGQPAPATAGRLIRWAWLYDAVVRVISLGQDRALRRWTVDLAAIQPGETVLDVGCGTGDLTLEAAGRAAGLVIGLDAAPEMIAVARQKAARRRAAVDFRVGLIEATGLPAGTCDVVLSSLMMHHLPADLQRRGLAECRRVLKPGGRLVVVDFLAPAPGGPAGGANWLHPAPAAAAPDLARLVSAAGFGDVTSGTAPFPSLGYVGGRAAA